MKASNYHRLLRISLLVSAIALVFESGLINQSTSYIAKGTHVYLANVINSPSQTVETKNNLYAIESSNEDKQSAALQEAAKEREVGPQASTEIIYNNRATYTLSIVVFMLLVLIILNYALDYIRSRRREGGPGWNRLPSPKT